jgi:hypothetical protein
MQQRGCRAECGPGACPELTGAEEVHAALLHDLNVLNRDVNVAFSVYTSTKHDTRQLVRRRKT